MGRKDDTTCRNQANPLVNIHHPREEAIAEFFHTHRCLLEFVLDLLKKHAGLLLFFYRKTVPSSVEVVERGSCVTMRCD